MNNTKAKSEDTTLVRVQSFVKGASGLEIIEVEGSQLRILQIADGKTLRIDTAALSEIIPRKSQQGEAFLQLNFQTGIKILLTENLIGFKPAHPKALDISKLPRVVTTPDLLSIVEAIEEALTTEAPFEEVEILKKVYDAVVIGGEQVGFSLNAEKNWIQSLSFGDFKASA